MNENKNNSTLNLEMAFDYTEKVLNATNKTIDNLNTRTSAFLALGGVLLKFASDLYDKCPSTQTFKILALICLCLSVVANLYALLAKSAGYVMKPRKLMNEYFDEDNNYVKGRIINTLINAQEELEMNATKKANLLNWGIGLIALAATASTLNIILGTFYKGICS